MHFQRNSKACLGPQDGVHWVVLAHLRGGAGGPEGTLNALRTPPSSVRCRASCLLSGALTRAHSYSQSLRVKVGTQHARIGGARGLTPLLDVCLPPVPWAVVALGALARASAEGSWVFPPSVWHTQHCHLHW